MTVQLAQFLGPAYLCQRRRLFRCPRAGNVQSLVAIEALRYGHKLNVIYDIDPAVLSCLIPRLCLQPLIENAIKPIHVLQCRVLACYKLKIVFGFLVFGFLVVDL
jgi:hypothetical protein